MSALDGVHWRPLLVELAESLPDAGPDLVWCLERSKLLPPLATTLAVLSVMATRPRLTPLFAAHATDSATADAVADWLYWTSRVALRTVEAPEPAIVPGPVEPMFVDPRLPTLPLLGVAAEYAETSPYPLVIRWAQLGPVTGGRFMPEVTVPVMKPMAGIEPTVVNLIEISPTAHDMGAAWLHEFAHALDPAPRSGSLSEPFADALAELLANRRPATLTDTKALIEEARERVTAPKSWPDLAEVPQAVPGGDQAAVAAVDLPAPGLPSFLALASLPLQPEEATQ